MDGKKEVIKVGLILIQSLETTLFQFNYDDLLHFIISDLNKNSFFQNSNKDNFTNKYKKIKIHSFLISNLENEFKHENQSLKI